MTHRLGTRVWATGIAVLAAASACGGTSTNSGPSLSSSVSSATSPPASPTSTAAANATATLRRYFAVIDHLSQDPSANLASLQTIAASAELSAQRTFISGERRRGERQTGNTQIAAIKVEAINLDNMNPAAGIVPTVTIDVCWNVAHVDVVNTAGHSIITSARPDVGWTRYSVANYNYASRPAEGWRVASGQDLRRSPCTAG